EACRREREHNERNFRERVHGRFLSAILERDDFSSNRHPALAFWWSIIFFRKPVPTPDQVRGRLFRDHALAPFTARANTESSSNRYDKSDAAWRSCPRRGRRRSPRGRKQVRHPDRQPRGSQFGGRRPPFDSGLSAFIAVLEQLLHIDG